MIHYFVAGILDLIFGAIALTKNRDGTTKAFALAASCIAAWSFELFVLSSLGDKFWRETLFHILRVGMFLIPPALALLTWRLIGSRSRHFYRWVLVPGFTLSIALGVLNTFIFPSELRQVSSGYLPVPDLIYYGFIANFAWCFLASIVLGAFSYRTVTAREKQKLKWMLISLILTFTFGALAIYLLKFDFYLSRLIGVVPNLVFVSSLLYATIRHELMDIRAILSAALARTLILALFSGSYFALITSVSIQTSLTNALIAVAFFAVFLEAYPRLLKWLLPNTNRLLAASTYNYDEVTEHMRGQFSKCNSYAELNDLLDYLFHHVIKVRHYQLFLAENQEGAATRFVSLGNPNKTFDLSGTAPFASKMPNGHSIVMIDETAPELKSKLEQNSAISCFPIVFNGAVVALIFVGRSLTSASYYRYDDIRLMQWMVSELAQALQRVCMLEKLHQEMAEAKKKLSLLNVMNLYHHDIKAPLSIIDGVVSNDLYDEEKRRQVILEQVAWGSHLITTMARLLNGERKIKVERISLAQVLSDCAHVFSRLIPNLRTHFGETEEIDGDAEDLKILFINVLKNAYEATKPGAEADIEMRTWADSGRLYVSIKDAGIGMNDKQLAGLWSGLESTKKGGSGIGLQTIKRIADEHRASIQVESASDQGTTFTFGFPLHHH
jgi:signal transduction histidine kinase